MHLLLEGGTGAGDGWAGAAGADDANEGSAAARMAATAAVACNITFTLALLSGANHFLVTNFSPSGLFVLEMGPLRFSTKWSKLIFLLLRVELEPDSLRGSSGGKKMSTSSSVKTNRVIWGENVSLENG